MNSSHRNRSRFNRDHAKAAALRRCFCGDFLKSTALPKGSLKPLVNGLFNIVLNVLHTLLVDLPRNMAIWFMLQPTRLRMLMLAFSFCSQGRRVIK